MTEEVIYNYVVRECHIDNVNNPCCMWKEIFDNDTNFDDYDEALKDYREKIIYNIENEDKLYKKVDFDLDEIEKTTTSQLQYIHDTYINDSKVYLIKEVIIDISDSED